MDFVIVAVLAAMLCLSISFILLYREVVILKNKIISANKEREKCHSIMQRQEAVVAFITEQVFNRNDKGYAFNIKYDVNFFHLYDANHRAVKWIASKVNGNLEYSKEGKVELFWRPKKD